MRAHLQVSPYDQHARHHATRAVHQAAQVLDNPADLINVAIEELMRARCELPAFGTLDRLAGRVRVIRTIFLLEYLSNLQLRQEIIASTNKVEAYNGFAKFLFFGGEGVIGEHDREEQEKCIKYNDLVANAQPAASPSPPVSNLAVGRILLGCTQRVAAR